MRTIVIGSGHEEIAGSARKVFRQFQLRIAAYWRTIAATGSLHLISANLFTQALGFISSLLVVRFLKPAELGETRVIATYIAYVQLLGSLGLTSSVLTFIPRTEDPAVRRYWLRITLMLTCGATVLLSLVGAWMSWRGWLMGSASTSYWYRWSLFGAVASVATNVLVSFYQAERAVRELAGVQSAVRIGALFLCVGGAWAGGFEGYIIAGIVSSFVMLASLGFARMGRKLQVKPVILPSGYLRVAFLALLGLALWTAGRTADVVILDRFVTDRTQFGCYSLALSITMIFSLLNGTVQTISVPFFAARHESADWVVRKAFKWQSIGAAVCFATCALTIGLTTVLIQPIYGRAYGASVHFLVPLLLAQCCLATFHIQAAALLGIGLVRVNTMVGGIVVPISVLITYMMTRRYGINGAAWGQVLSSMIYSAVQSAWGWTELCNRSSKRITARRPASLPPSSLGNVG